MKLILNPLSETGTAARGKRAAHSGSPLIEMVFDVCQVGVETPDAWLCRNTAEVNFTGDLFTTRLKEGRTRTVAFKLNQKPVRLKFLRSRIVSVNITVWVVLDC